MTGNASWGWFGFGFGFDNMTNNSNNELDTFHNYNNKSDSIYYVIVSMSLDTNKIIAYEYKMVSIRICIRYYVYPEITSVKWYCTKSKKSIFTMLFYK